MQGNLQQDVLLEVSLQALRVSMLVTCYCKKPGSGQVIEDVEMPIVNVKVRRRYCSDTQHCTYYDVPARRPDEVRSIPQRWQGDNQKKNIYVSTYLSIYICGSSSSVLPTLLLSGA